MKRPIRVLLFSSLFPSAARPMHGLFVETRLRELLKTGRIEVRVVAPVPWFPSTDERYGERALFARTPAREDRHGIDVLHPRYALPPRVGMNIAPLSMALGAWRAVRRLRADGFDFDVIDAHYYYPDGVAAAILSAWFDRPLVVTARGSDINLIADYRWPRRLLQWASRRAAASIGVSGALVARMREIGFDGDRLAVMRNGVDLARFRPLDGAAMRRDLGLCGAPQLLTVGNLHEHKGQRLCVDALARLRQRHPGAQLAIVGEGPDRAWLQARAVELGLADAVRLVGPVPNTELARWYSATDVLLLASSREGWPNVLLEAMACGAPVVATQVGGVAEIVQNRTVGRRVTQRSPEALADAIDDVLAAGSDRAAIRAYAEGFGWERTSLDQLALFERLAV